MPTYVDIDGVPASADPWLLTTLLRDEYGFDGVVVSDYYAVSFLELQHAVAAGPGQAAVLALTAGLDVELPGTRCFGEPLLDLAARGEVPREIIDRAVARVLRQKLELGLLDPGWTAIPGQASRRGRASGTAPDLDPPAQRDIARRLAEESVILLANGASGPARRHAAARRGRQGRRDRAARRRAARVLRLLLDAAGTSGTADGFDGPATAGPASRSPPCSPRCGPRASTVTGYARGLRRPHAGRVRVRRGGQPRPFGDVIVAVVGDEAGLFGRGTSGEGCDVD